MIRKKEDIIKLFHLLRRQEILKLKKGLFVGVGNFMRTGVSSWLGLCLMGIPWTMDIELIVKLGKYCREMGCVGQGKELGRQEKREEK